MQGTRYTISGGVALILLTSAFIFFDALQFFLPRALASMWGMFGLFLFMLILYLLGALTFGAPTNTSGMIRFFQTLRPVLPFIEFLLPILPTLTTLVGISILVSRAWDRAPLAGSVLNARSKLQAPFKSSVRGRRTLRQIATKRRAELKRLDAKQREIRRVRKVVQQGNATPGQQARLNRLKEMDKKTRREYKNTKNSTKYRDARQDYAAALGSDTGRMVTGDYNVTENSTNNTEEKTPQSE